MKSANFCVMFDSTEQKTLKERRRDENEMIKEKYCRKIKYIST